MHFNAVKKSSKVSGFVTRMRFMRGMSFKLGMSKGCHLSIDGILKGYHFCPSGT